MSLPVIYSTREDWLNGAITELKPFFLINGVSISDRIRVSCALPSNAKRTNFKSVGECFPSTNSADAHYEIFISPVLADPIKVFETLIAMLCHTAKGALNHGKPYQKIADAMLLLPNGTQSARYKSVTHGGAFIQAYGQIIDSLGAYVHAELSASVGKKQGTRMLLAQCPSCGYAVRLTSKWAYKRVNGNTVINLPICPNEGDTLALI
jgi:hypothetical protein